jgi:hypothetical protein
VFLYGDGSPVESGVLAHATKRTIARGATVTRVGGVDGGDPDDRIVRGGDR